jgi:hypothetical protein
MKQAKGFVNAIRQQRRVEDGDLDAEESSQAA